MSISLLVFNPGQQGGIVKYAWHQAEALARLGSRVTVICDKSSAQNVPDSLLIRDVLIPKPLTYKHRGRLQRLIFLFKQLIGNQLILFRAVLLNRPDVVVLASYSEYLSPLYIWLQLILTKLFRVVFVAILHDPVRNFSIGPLWWHKLSVQMTYWPLSVVLVHQVPPLEASVPSYVRVVEVPHGLYPIELPISSPKNLRLELGIPDEAVVFLSFGFIRDNKNLDLLIQALPDNPSAYLIIAGRMQSEATNKPISFYERLARELGVFQRVRFITHYIAEEDIGHIFWAADVLALTYSASFRSQSGVLNTAALIKKPLLVSCGTGPMKEFVERFGLGEFIEPDSGLAVSLGMKRLIHHFKGMHRSRTRPPIYLDMNWSGYIDYASWDRNATITMDAILKHLS